MCDVTAPAELLLPSSTRAPAQARAFLRRSGCPEHALDLLDDALLLVSELVTNSVVHGGPPIVLQVECDSETLRVRVRDGSSVPPTPRQADEDAEGGRGMTLVDLLTDTWGIEPVVHGPGKAVWFQLRA